MSSNSSKAGGGIGCFTVIGIVFVILKVLAVEPVAHWSWLWVLCPFWAPIAFALVVGVAFGFVMYILSR